MVLSHILKFEALAVYLAEYRMHVFCFFLLDDFLEENCRNAHLMTSFSNEKLTKTYFLYTFYFMNKLSVCKKKKKKKSQVGNLCKRSAVQRSFSLASFPFKSRGPVIFFCIFFPQHPEQRLTLRRSVIICMLNNSTSGTPGA